MRTHHQATEDRRHERRIIATQPLISAIIGPFREMPGLCLHVNQAARLFGLPPSTCEVILRDVFKG